MDLWTKVYFEDKFSVSVALDVLFEELVYLFLHNKISAEDFSIVICTKVMW